MSTIIVFGGGNAVVVAPGLEEVKAALQREPGKRLLEFERGAHDPHPDRTIYVNGSQVAYIEGEPERSWQGSRWTS